MGFFSRIFNNRIDAHIHIHVDGVLRVDKDGLHEAIVDTPKDRPPSIKPNIKANFVPRTNAGEIMPDLGTLEIPETDFGEQVNDE